MVVEIEYRGSRYAIDHDAVPGAGWRAEHCLLLSQIHREQKTVKGRAVFEDRHRKLLRAASIRQILAYIAEIERGEVDEVERLYRIALEKTENR